MRGSSLEKIYRYIVNGYLTDEGFEICKNILHFLDQNQISEFLITHDEYIFHIDIDIYDFTVAISIGDTINIGKMTTSDYMLNFDLEDLALDQWKIIDEYLNSLL